MTLQIPGTDKEKDELLTDMYEALKTIRNNHTVMRDGVIIRKPLSREEIEDMIDKAFAKAEGR